MQTTGRPWVETSIPPFWIVLSQKRPVDLWIWDMISVKQSPTFRFCFRQKIIQISKSWIFTMWPVDQGPNRKLHWSPTPIRSWEFWEFSARGADLFHKLSLWALGGKEHLSIHFVRPVTAQWRHTAIVDGVETGWNWWIRPLTPAASHLLEELGSRGFCELYLGKRENCDGV